MVDINKLKRAPIGANIKKKVGRWIIYPRKKGICNVEYVVCPFQPGKYKVLTKLCQYINLKTFSVYSSVKLRLD